MWSNTHIITCLSADKDSTRPDAYNLGLHEVLTSASSMCIFARMSAVCRFMDKYVSGLYGSRSIINWKTKNKGKHFLDMVTMSDIVAYTVAVVENSYEAWNEEHGIENAGEGEEQELYQRPQKTVKTKFTNRVGKKRQCNMLGGVLMEFTSTTVYVKVGGPYQKILHGLFWRRNGPRMKIKQTSVIQAGGRRMNTKNQKMTTTMEETNVQIFHYGTNLSCWMEMKISWLSDRPRRE